MIQFKRSHRLGLPATMVAATTLFLSQSLAGTLPTRSNASSAIAHIEAAELTPLSHPAPPIDQSASILAAHPVATSEMPGTAEQIGGIAYMETATASQPAASPRIASLVSPGASLLAHSSDMPVASERLAPDRGAVKPETALPSDEPRATEVRTSAKSGPQLMRSASIATGARSNANSIRNRIWLKHAAN